MKTNLLSTLAVGMLITVSAHAQDNTTSAEREARRQVRQQKIENSKGELKEMGKKVGTEATELGRETKEKAKKAGDAIERKVDERKAKRGTARRDTL